MKKIHFSEIDTNQENLDCQIISKVMTINFTNTKSGNIFFGRFGMSKVQGKLVKV